jgi:hypothetical protein
MCLTPFPKPLKKGRYLSLAPYPSAALHDPSEKKQKYAGEPLAAISSNNIFEAPKAARQWH